MHHLMLRIACHFSCSLGFDMNLAADFTPDTINAFPKLVGDTETCFV